MSRVQNDYVAKVLTSFSGLLKIDSALILCHTNKRLSHQSQDTNGVSCLTGCTHGIALFVGVGDFHSECLLEPLYREQ